MSRDLSHVYAGGRRQPYMWVSIDSWDMVVWPVSLSGGLGISCQDKVFVLFSLFTTMILRSLPYPSHIGEQSPWERIWWWTKLANVPRLFIVDNQMACYHGHGSYPQLNNGSGAKWIKSLTRDRLGGFNGGRYSDLNLASVLYTHRLDTQEHVKLKV